MAPLTPTRRLPRLSSIALVVAGVLCALRAHAYRPFDGTDADVVPVGETEIELGPAGYLKEQHEHLLVTPRYVLNYGFAPDVELVADGRGLVSMDQPIRAGDGRFTLDDTDVLVKWLIRRGALQGGTGPSVALESGALLPTVGRDTGMGASAAGIVSLRNAYGSVHLNAAFELTRERHDRDLFTGVIVEGPDAWRLRPVAEVYWERNFSAETRLSLLGGAILRVNETVSLDAGLRVGKVDEETAYEVRAGVTWAFEAHD